MTPPSKDNHGLPNRLSPSCGCPFISSFASSYDPRRPALSLDLWRNGYPTNSFKTYPTGESLHANTAAPSPVPAPGYTAAGPERLHKSEHTPIDLYGNRNRRPRIISRSTPYARSASYRSSLEYILSSKTEIRTLDGLFPTESRDYPNLHPILARDTTNLLYDVRRTPRADIPPVQYAALRTCVATREPVDSIRIISPYFPWPIYVGGGDSGDGQRDANAGAHSAQVQLVKKRVHVGVCVRDVWYALHLALLEPLTEAEWANINISVPSGMVGDNPSRCNRVLRAASRREDGKGEAQMLRRVDWLGSRSKFCGLYKDPELEEKLRLPTDMAVRETWVADFTWNR